MNGLCSNLESLDPRFKKQVEVFLKELEDAGIQYYINECKRSSQTQNAYYAQGRKSLNEVNKLRKEAGLWNISEAENSHTITNTLNSKHLLGLAIDICPAINNRPYWNASNDKYKAIADIGVKCGLDAGYYFRGFKDGPHFQMKE